MNKLCVGLLTYCNSETHPERYDIFKTCLNSLKNLVGENVYIYALDNGSSEDVIASLNECPYLDDVYQSRNNLYDVLAVNFLVRKAKEVSANYVMHLEDDFLFYRDDFLNTCFEFLEKNKDCGYLRILKYDFKNKILYDKLGGHPDRDMANSQRHYNNVSKDALTWASDQQMGKFDFYKTNWHWYNFANICNLSVFEKIIPKRDVYPMQALEGEMMKNYYNLNLMVGVMDLGVVSHMGHFDKKTSLRLAFKKTGCHSEKQFPIVKMKNVEEEIEYLL